MGEGEGEGEGGGGEGFVRCAGVGVWGGCGGGGVERWEEEGQVREGGFFVRGCGCEGEVVGCG